MDCNRLFQYFSATCVTQPLRIPNRSNHSICFLPIKMAIAETSRIWRARAMARRFQCRNAVAQLVHCPTAGPPPESRRSSSLPRHGPARERESGTSQHAQWSSMLWHAMAVVSKKRPVSKGMALTLAQTLANIPTTIAEFTLQIKALVHWNVSPVSQVQRGICILYNYI